MTRALGIHHVTAIAADPQRNLDFYTGILGLRLVKRTVNYDDPSTYHFYFGDQSGRPGSLLTFFPWPGARRGQAGAGQAGVTSFAVGPESLKFWLDRFARYSVRSEPPTRRFGEQVLPFLDPDGLRLELVAGPATGAGWLGGPVSLEHAVRGLHGVTLWERAAEPTRGLLLGQLGFREAGTEGDVLRLAAGEGGAGALVDLKILGESRPGIAGAGTVHHVAWRAADDAAQIALRQGLVDSGLSVTPVIDRQYFHSIYFHEPGGVLFEVATDAPGFTLDEPLERLGERLMLPPQYERERAGIEAMLPAIRYPSAEVRASR